MLLVGSTPSSHPLPVQWVHSSDLIDPTPFLVPRTVLLTTGGQFDASSTPASVRAYVTRLIEAGVTALGFGVEIAHDRVPHQLIVACERAALPLFRVPYDTPFIAISQSATRKLATVRYERELRSLETQRAISRAAGRPRGIAASIDTLASRLDRWVALSTVNGQLTHVSPASAAGLLQQPWVRSAVTEITQRGGRANVTRQHGDVRVHLQTVTATTRTGHSRVHGVLIVEGDTPLDPSDRASIELVATLAAVNFAQHGDLRAGEDALRSAIVRLLISGNAEVAADVAEAAGLRLPSGELHVVSIGDDPAREIVEIVTAATEGQSGTLTAMHDGHLTVLVPARAIRGVESRLAQHGLHAGVSTRHPLTHTGDAVEEARVAFASSAQPGQSVVRFTPRMAENLFSLIGENTQGVTRARRMLTPVTDYDDRHDEALTHTLRVWLANHGAQSATAEALGVHRHTVASRLKLIASLLQRDLGDPGVRAEIWFALELTDSGHR